MVRKAGRPQLSISPKTALAVLVSVLMIAIVLGISVASQGTHHAKVSRTSAGASIVVARTLSCIPDAPGASTRVGTLPTVPGASASTVDKAGRVTFAPAVASTGYGTQWVRGNGWLSARTCPEPSDDWWFVGVGAGIAHRSVLTLDNPRTNDATVSITAFGPGGQVSAPGLSDVLVPAGQSVTMDLGTVAPAVGDLSVNVSATRGLVSASVWETWAASPTSPMVKSWVAAAPTPANRVQLIGVPAKVTAASLLVANPSVNTVVATLEETTANATYTPKAPVTITIPPQSTIAVDLSSALSTGFSALTVTSSSPITAALRTIRDNAEAYAAAALSLGTGSVVGLPGGIAAALQLTSPVDAAVQVKAVNAEGTPVTNTSVSVSAGTAVSVALPTTATAVSVGGTGMSTVSGAVVLDNGSMAVMALIPSASSSVIPPVIAAQY